MQTDFKYVDPSKRLENFKQKLVSTPVAVKEICDIMFHLQLICEFVYSRIGVGAVGCAIFRLVFLR